MSALDADNCAPVTLQPHEVEELHWLLGQLEDWLLHASDEVIDELGDFVNHLYPRGAVLHVIDTLGLYCVELRRRGKGPQR
jgi:hypothetical protein